MSELKNENVPIKKDVPRIGITIGDAAGIGAEITLKALAEETSAGNFQLIIIGDARFVRQKAEQLNLNFDFDVVEKGKEIPFETSRPIIYDLANLNEKIIPGEESAVSGKASAEYIETAVKLWEAGVIDAVATAPISKRAIALCGYNYPGHTEFLAHLTGTKDFAMSFFAEKLRVVLLSTHVSLREALEVITRENLVRLIRFTNEELAKLLKRSNVKIAVAGLNPHASEGGMFGNEEEKEILPAINECRNKFGIEVYGPFSPDTIFLRGFKGEFDAVIACYHDQATIAVKCLSFGSSVNVTLGLPLIRTSVDHGTAFDIAGQNIADASSMRAAINLAASLAAN